MADADAEALRRATDRIRARHLERESPRSRVARLITDWRVIVVAALGLLGGGAWGYARWSNVVKKPDLAGVATQADVQRAVEAHAAEPGHALELRQHVEDHDRLERVEGKVEKLDGKVDTILQLIQAAPSRRR